jgi:hypothetical protein
MIMESVTDPDLLKDRVFFKLGEFVFDNRKAVIAVGLLSCILLGSLMSMGPDWAEAWGEGDLESVEAIDLKDSAFASEEDGVERFVLLINHPTMTDQSLEWQNAVIKALEDFSEIEDVDIEYSWNTAGDEREKFVHEDDDGFWARNVVTINLDRKKQRNSMLKTGKASK